MFGLMKKCIQRRKERKFIVLFFGTLFITIFLLVAHTLSHSSPLRRLTPEANEARAPQRSGRESEELHAVNIGRAHALENQSITDSQPSGMAPPKKESGGGFKRKSHLDAKFKNFRTILYWNDLYGRKDFGVGYGHEPFLERKCRVHQCYATHNTSIVAPEEADAIIWHLRAKNRSFPPKRSPHTFYIFYVIESALYTYADLNKYNGVFNWTMTYRLDSDFPKPYGRIEPPPSHSIVSNVETKNYAAGKTKLAAWFVSNCWTLSKREHLVRTLKKYIRVDMYGKCGNLTCPRSEHEECLKMLDAEYKFYFSFENSLCMDYITEKFFLPIKYNVVPVVYGLGYEKLNLPEHSYIDLMDFSSLKELADYLLYLDSNDTAYNEYFRWKTMGYQIIPGDIVKSKAFCDLCERLHEAHNSTHSQDLSIDEGNSNLDASRRRVISESYRKVYTNLHEWFVAGKCTLPNNNPELSPYLNEKAILP